MKLNEALPQYFVPRTLKDKEIIKRYMNKECVVAIYEEAKNGKVISAINWLEPPKRDYSAVKIIMIKGSKKFFALRFEKNNSMVRRQQFDYDWITRKMNSLIWREKYKNAKLWEEYMTKVVVESI